MRSASQACLDRPGHLMQSGLDGGLDRRTSRLLRQILDGGSLPRRREILQFGQVTRANSSDTLFFPLQLLSLAIFLLERRDFGALLGGAFFGLQPLGFAALSGGLFHFQACRFVFLLGDEFGFLLGLLCLPFLLGLEGDALGFFLGFLGVAFLLGFEGDALGFFLGFLGAAFLLGFEGDALGFFFGFLGAAFLLGFEGDAIRFFLGFLGAAFLFGLQGDTVMLLLRRLRIFAANALKKVNTKLRLTRKRRCRELADEFYKIGRIGRITDAAPSGTVAFAWIQKVVGAQRGRHLGMLSALGPLVNIIGDAAEHRCNFKARLLDAVEEGCRERAVPAVSVIRDMVWRCCIGDDRILRVIDARQPVRFATSAPTAGRDELPCERIVTAGIENDDFYAFRALNRAQYVALIYGPVFDIDCVLDLDVRRKKVVPSFVLETMARIKKEGRVRVCRFACEFGKRVLKFALTKIGPKNDVEPNASQSLSNIISIIGRINELGRKMRVLAIAYNESDALIRQRGSDPKGQYQHA